MLRCAGQDRRTRQRGQVMVLFAIVLPLILVVGSFVITVGNWWVHKRHLQTQVDAAALAAGPLFSACFDANLVSQANPAIRDTALDYAGDTGRDPTNPPALSIPVNLQVQEPDDARVVLNSATYWTTGDPTPGPNVDSPLDNTFASPGDPCSTKILDVKATDDEAPTLWGWLPFVASPKARARIEIQKVLEGEGVLPWAVPDVDPLAVAAIFVDEETGLVLYRDKLVKQGALPGDPFVFWGLDFSNFNVSSQNIGVIILVSKDPNPTLPNVGASPAAACTQAPRRWACYAGPGDTDGLSFIHGYDDDATGSAASPVIKDVRLSPGSCSTDPLNLSAPFFVLNADLPPNGECTVGVEAVIDFGITGDPTEPPAQGGVSARNVSVNGDAMQWSAGGIGGPLGTWTTTGSVALAAESGRNVFTISGRAGQGAGNAFSFTKVAAPYVANDDPTGAGDSGPVAFLELSHTGGQANSLPDGPIGTISVSVGLWPPLTAGQKVAMRVASPSGSKNQAIDCDANISFDEEIREGCRTRFRLNYFDWDGDPNTPSPYSWRDIECLSYDQSAPNPPPPGFLYTLPVGSPYNPDPRPDCGRLEPGDRLGLFRKGINERFETPCTPMLWQNWSSPQEKANDRRFIMLVITDQTAFEGAGASPGDTIPVKTIGWFYVSGWTTGGQAQGCPDNEPPPATWKLRANSGDVWGYFDKGVIPSSGGIASGEICAPGFDPGVCIAVLVE